MVTDADPEDEGKIDNSDDIMLEPGDGFLIIPVNEFEEDNFIKKEKMAYLYYQSGYYDAAFVEALEGLKMCLGHISWEANYYLALVRITKKMNQLKIHKIFVDLAYGAASRTNNKLMCAIIERDFPASTKNLKLYHERENDDNSNSE